MNKPTQTQHKTIGQQWGHKDWWRAKGKNTQEIYFAFFVVTDLMGFTCPRPFFERPLFLLFDVWKSDTKI